MPRILLVADAAASLGKLAEALAKTDGVDILWAHDGKTALERVAGDAPQVVVMDETVGGATGLAWIRQLLAVDAFVQTAVVSRLPQDAFHEASEGLGIMLQLPPAPGRDEARQLLDIMGRLV